MISSSTERMEDQSGRASASAVDGASPEVRDDTGAADGVSEEDVVWRWEELSRLDAPDTETELDTGPEGAPEEAGLEVRLSEAYESGLQEGRRQGRSEARNELAAAVEAARAVQESLENERELRARKIEEEVLMVALAVARHIVGRELEGSREAYAELVREALARVPVDQPVTVKLHPADLSAISTVSSEDDSPVPIAGAREVRWTADAGVSRGGCILETEDQIVDGRIEQCMERIFKEIRSG